MRKGLYTRSARRSYLVRGVAVFFVLFVFFDLAFPQLCQEAVDGITSRMHAPTQSAEQKPGAADLAAFVKGSRDTGREQQQERAPHEDDCLGCCSHVLMSDLVTPVAAAEVVLQSSPPEADWIPTPSLRSPYHPPRIS